MRKTQSFKKNEVLSFEDSPELSCLARAVECAGDAVKTASRDSEISTGDGHRSIVTAGDRLARDIMVAYLTEDIPGIKILSEEAADHQSLLSKLDPVGILGQGIFAVIDPIDGTVRFSHDMAGWCVGAGLIRNGEIQASAIYAPADNEGMLVLAERGRGTWLAEWDKELRRIAVQDTEPEKSVLLLGVDTLLYRSIVSITPALTHSVQAIYTTGSGILGLAKIATGKAQVVIQTPQKAWDWAAGYRAVIESGNAIQFFRIGSNGNIMPVETYDYAAFQYEPSGRLGYVAGVPSLVQKIWRMLPKTGLEKINPDTAGAVLAFQ